VNFWEPSDPVNVVIALDWLLCQVWYIGARIIHWMLQMQPQIHRISDLFAR